MKHINFVSKLSKILKNQRCGKNRICVKGIEKCSRFVGSAKTLKSYISAGQRFQKKPLNKKVCILPKLQNVKRIIEIGLVSEELEIFEVGYRFQQRKLGS